MNYEHLEIEVRFLEINQDEISGKLKQLGAEDLGEGLIEEIIFYDKKLEWQKGNRKLVRIRKTKSGVYLTYKHQEFDTATGTEEIELKIDDSTKAEVFLERLGLVAFRHQQKKRHSFKLGNVIIDIDTWPRIPTYLELEGPSEGALKEVAGKLELDWSKAVFENPRIVIEKYYHIPVKDMRYFTFDHFEK